MKRRSVLIGLALSAVVVLTAAAVSFSNCENNTTTSAAASTPAGDHCAAKGTASAATSTMAAGDHCASKGSASAAAASGDACCMGEANASMKKPLQATFAVEGVQCDDCVKKIGKAVKGVKGVKKYEFDKTHNALMVAFAPSKTNCHEIADAVTKAGFPATMSVVTAFDGKLVCPAGAGKEDCEKMCPYQKKDAKSSSTSM